MKNAVSFLIIVVFFLIVYLYTTGKIEKRKNRKEAKRVGRLPVEAERPDEFPYFRVAVFPVSEIEQSISEMEQRMAGRINRLVRELEDVGGHSFDMDSFLFQDVAGGEYLVVMIRCMRPHVRDEG